MTPGDEWARCRDWIANALERDGFYTLEWVEAEIASGRLTFWPSPNGATLTEFIEYPRGKALNIFATVGKENASLEELLGLVEPHLIAWARSHGCKWILGFGRPGFERRCKDMGYRPKWHVIVKEI